MRAHTRKCLWQKVLCAPYLRTSNYHTQKVVSFNVHAESLYLAFNFSLAPCSWNIKSTFPLPYFSSFFGPRNPAARQRRRHELLLAMSNANHNMTRKAKANGRRQDVCGKMSEKQGHHRVTYTQCGPKGYLLTSFWVENLFFLLLTHLRQGFFVFVK